MGFEKVLGGAFLAIALGSTVQAATIINYDLTGASGTAGSEPAFWAPTSAAPGITGMNLTRGAGILPANLTNGFSSNNWTLGSSSATAQANDDYYQWGLTVDSGYEADLSTLNFSMRRSAIAAPDTYELYASFDNFATAGTLITTFNYFGRSSGTAPTTVVDGQWMTSDTPGQGNGNPISTINLASTPSLQDIPGGNTVTFRLYGYGNIAGAADSNTVALGRIAGPLIGGDVTLVPEPASLALIGCAALAAMRRRH